MTLSARAGGAGRAGRPAAHLIKALDGVHPYDWRTFLMTRVTSTGDHAPLGGVERGG